MKEGVIEKWRWKGRYCKKKGKSEGQEEGGVSNGVKKDWMEKLKMEMKK